MKGLRRLADLYGRVEKMEAAAALVAADETSRVAGELASEQASGREQGMKARSALADGNRAEWMLAHRAGEMIVMRAEVLAGAQAQCEKARDEAMQRYIASRLKTQQVAAATGRRQDLEAVVKQRQDQAATDDRYAARLLWTRGRSG